MGTKPTSQAEQGCLERWAAKTSLPSATPAAHSVGKVTRARVALGGVGTKSWRSPEAEQELTGQSATEAVFRKAAEAALRDAKPQSQNGFKVELAKRCLVHALKLVTQPA